MFSDCLIEENAKVFISTDNYTEYSESVSLSKGTPELTVSPLNNEFVFDLISGSVTYPEGMFNFIKNDGKNAGVLTISTNNSNRFGFEYMLQQKVIYINDSPARSSADFETDFITKPSYMIIKLRNI